MPYSDNGYLDPIHIVWRKGTADDPYIDKAEYLKVVNQKAVLSEIPEKFSRVRINGMEEVNIDKITNLALKENQYAVNYSTGVVQVHNSKEAETLNVIYKGRGFIQYPSSRIYHQDEMNDVVKSLDRIIQDSLNSVQYLHDSVDDKISEYQAIRDVLLEKIDDSNVATDEANIATQEAKTATDMALDAYDTTRLVFKPYVSTRYYLNHDYPDAEVGWTVQVYDSGIRYRYDGSDWVPIDLFGGNILPATETRDGLMSKESYQKLQDMEQNLNDLSAEYDSKDERTLTFVYPYLSQGVNNITARFPYDGTIMSVKGICTKFGTDTFTEIDIEKSSDDMATWNTIFDNSFLTFDTSSHFDSGSHNLLITGVNANDLFRISARTLSSEIEGVTIEIKIKLN